MDYKLEDLIDIELIQSLQEKLNLVYSFPSAIIDNEGKVLTAVAWQDICTKFHRTNPECEKECIKSDLYILDHISEAKPAVSYQCPHGMIDNAAPIIIDGKHLGNFFTGQFFLEKPDLEFFKKQAKKYGFDEKTYLKAVEKVPIWTKEKLTLYLDFIKGFIEIIAGIGLKAIKEIETRKIVNEREELFQSIVHNSSDLVVLTDEKGIVTYLSPQCEEVLGYPASKIIGLIMPDFIHPDDKIRCQHEWEQVFLHGQELHDLEYRIIDYKNKERWISHSARMVKTNEKVLGMQSTIRNITEKKQWEESIKKSEAKHSSMISNISDVIGIIGADGLMKYKSSNIEKWFGWQPEDLIGSDGFLNVHPDDLERIQKEFFTVLEKENSSITLEFRYKCKDGSYKPIELTAKNLTNDPVINGVLLNYYDITERKQTEIALVKAKEKAEESQRKFKSLMKQSPFVVELYNLNGLQVSVNKAYEELWGFPEETTVNKFNILESKEVEQSGLIKFVKRAYSGESVDVPIYIFDSTGDTEAKGKGRTRWLNTRIYPLKDNFGIVNHIVVMHQDVTDSKQSELELIAAKEKAEESEQEFRNLAESMPQIVWTTDVDGLNTYFNKQWVDYTGLTLEESSGHGWIKPFHPDDQIRASEAWQNAVKHKGQYSIEARLRRYDGIYNWWLVRGVPQIDQNGKILKWFGTCTDIDKSKRTEQELIIAKEKAEESEKKYNIIAEYTYDWETYYDNNENIIFINSAFEKITGYNGNDFLVKKLQFKDFVHQDDLVEVERTFADIFIGKTIDGYSFRIIHKEGKEVFAEICSQAVLGLNNELIGIRTSVRDITERKQAELELIKAKERAEESEELKSAFLANMSHEIRTPLNGILGFLDLLTDEEYTQDEKEKFAGLIHYSSDRLIKTIDNLIDIARIESNQVLINQSVFSLDNLCENILGFWSPSAGSKGLKLYSPANNNVRIRADQHLLNGIFNNLISNGIKFTDKGYIKFGYLVENRKNIKFFVEDTGIGIPFDKHHLIFNRFEQADNSTARKFEGSGLGLSIVKSYVEMLGGEILIDKDYKGDKEFGSKGTRFVFTLPNCVVL